MGAFSAVFGQRDRTHQRRDGGVPQWRPGPAPGGSPPPALTRAARSRVSVLMQSRSREGRSGSASPGKGSDPLTARQALCVRPTACLSQSLPGHVISWFTGEQMEEHWPGVALGPQGTACLLYTSDAADETSTV